MQQSHRPSRRDDDCDHPFHSHCRELAVDADIHILMETAPPQPPYPLPFPAAGPPPLPYPTGPVPGFVLPDSQQQPSAPWITELASLTPGYEGSSYDKTLVAPPASTLHHYSQLEPAAGERLFPGLKDIDEHEVREALAAHVSDKWCWGGGAARDLQITSIHMSSSFHYHLETFTETRETAWTFVSTTQPPPPPAQYGAGDMMRYTAAEAMMQPPPPWSIEVTPEKDFSDSEQKLEVPNSSVVRTCHGLGCGGTGKSRCDTCNGTGSISCTWCNGTGQRVSSGAGGESVERCTSCTNGSGRNQCRHCTGSGLQECKICKGRGNVRYFIELHIKWENHEDDFVSDVAGTGLKKKYIKKVDGGKSSRMMVVQEESVPLLSPDSLSSFPDRSIADSSRSLILKHSKQFPLSRILKQRHSVKVVPIATVAFDYKGDNGIFYVYGDESDRRVYFKDYPQRICYCCSVA